MPHEVRSLRAGRKRIRPPPLCCPKSLLPTPAFAKACCFPASRRFPRGSSRNPLPDGDRSPRFYQSRVRAEKSRPGANGTSNRHTISGHSQNETDASSSPELLLLEHRRRAIRSGRRGRFSRRLANPLRSVSPSFGCLAPWQSPRPAFEVRSRASPPLPALARRAIGALPDLVYDGLNHGRFHDARRRNLRHL